MGEEMARATAAKAKPKRKPRKVASPSKKEGNRTTRGTVRKPKGYCAARVNAKPGERTGGRQKGTPNKMTKNLKEAILKACEQANADGTIGYLKQVAEKDPRTFCGLLGKVLPMTIASDGDNPLIPEKIKVEIVDAPGAGTA